MQKYRFLTICGTFKNVINVVSNIGEIFEIYLKSFLNQKFFDYNILYCFSYNNQEYHYIMLLMKLDNRQILAMFPEYIPQKH